MNTLQLNNEPAPEPTIDLVFAIHNHQPVGNFDFVIEKNYREAYLAFLIYLEKNPHIRLGIHYSGYLWEYIEHRHPDFLLRLKTLIERDQIELLGGAYYEAIVPILPETDSFLQLSRYRQKMEEFSGKGVQGMWLAERVWEPVLPSLIRKGGYSFTFLDEAHFSSAGVPRNRIWGVYQSEDRGDTINIFPIDKTLRYNIPFQEPEKTVEVLKNYRAAGVTLVTYGDDGEKFGGWPGTKKWVYDDGWLDRFFNALKNNPWIKMRLPAEALSLHYPQGLVYLPCASYEEMGEWTLPAETQIELRNLKADLSGSDLKNRITPFVRGGFWRQYLAKYPESRRLYRRLLRVSRKVSELERRKSTDATIARQSLMRGSANDAYWHGVFGGIYLPHLRSAVQKELILAETLCDRNLPRKKPDYNDDERIVVLENKSLRCEISPEMGGSVTALDLRQAGINLTDSMTRQSEAYHQRLREASSPGSADHSSIHDRLEFKEPNLAEKLVLDDHPRLCFLDRFLKPDFTLEDLKFNRPVEVGDFVKGNYEIVKIKKNILVLQRKGNVNGTQFLLYKSFLLKPEEMELNVKYLVQRDINVLKDFHFAPEIHINLLAPRSDDRYLLKDNEPFAKNNLGSQGELADCKTLSLVDDYQGIRVDLRAYPQPRWLWYPVETVSLSEAGVESVYQGSAIHPVWKIGALKKEPPQIIMAIRKRPNWKPVV